MLQVAGVSDHCPIFKVTVSFPAIANVRVDPGASALPTFIKVGRDGGKYDIMWDTQIYQS
jgi:hypothetical protein